MSAPVRLFASAIGLTALLCLGISSESLWTDEAFSAFIACHQNVGSLWNALLPGDSSDLQMWLYYFYLHFWISLFGDGEFALRSANIPFLFLYSAAIVWTRAKLFGGNWVWIAGLSPFVWAYAGEARPYMIIVSLSTVFLTCLIASLTDPIYANLRGLPWIGLSALLLGLNFHTLMILLLTPSVILIVTYRLISGSPLGMKRWIRPLLFLSPAFAAYFIFLIWTFKRGTNYDYARPDVLSMGSVLFRFLGLAGFAPNRQYDVAFGAYIPGMILAATGVFIAGGLTLTPAVRSRHARTISLAAALLVGICEAVTLSLAFKQQIEVRHLASLFGLILLLFFSGWHFLQSLNRRRTVLIAGSLVAAIWLICDYRLAFLPEYAREDFKGAVAETTALAGSAASEIAVVADPAAAAYYGLRMTSENGCFPLPENCQKALADLLWPQRHAAADATSWTPERIAAWLQQGEQKKTHILVISRSRHPMYAKSAWWGALRQTKSYSQIPFHGFFVYAPSVKKY